jgi:hypothetical protein
MHSESFAVALELGVRRSIAECLQSIESLVIDLTIGRDAVGLYACKETLSAIDETMKVLN